MRKYNSRIEMWRTLWAIFCPSCYNRVAEGSWVATFRDTKTECLSCHIKRIERSKGKLFQGEIRRDKMDHTFYGIDKQQLLSLILIEMV